MPALSDHVALRLEAYRRHALFMPGPAAEARLLEILTPVHELGEVRVLRATGRLDAVVAWRHDEESWFGPPVYTIAIDVRRGVDVEAWLVRTLEEVLPRLDASWDLLLDAGYDVAYRALRRLGAGVDSLQLLGHVDTALEHLGPGRALEGVALERMTRADIDAVITLYAETFSKAPEFCWFGAHPRYLRKQRERFETSIETDDHLELVLRTADGVRGHASGSVDQDNALWGPLGGMGLCFAPELRGRGVLRPVYRHLLEGMRERGARGFRGGTSQRSVIHLGAEMKRALQGVCFRRRAHFDESHFEPYLPLGAEPKA